MFERELKRGNEFLEYQKKIMGRGRLLSVSQGNYIGTNPPYGYDKTYVLEGKRKCPTLAINEEQATVVRMVFDMYANQDMSYHAIAARLTELNIAPPIRKYWSPSAVLHMITNPHYIGKVRWNFRKTVVVVEDGEVKKTNPIAKEGDYYLYEGKHPAIISEELYEKAQQRKGTIPRIKARHKISNPLAGIFYCQCGKAMVRRPLPRREPPHDYRFLCSEQIHCHTSSCVSDEVIDFLIELLNQKISEFEVEVKNENNDSVELHQKLIANLEKKLADNQVREIQQWESQFDPDLSKRMPQHIFQMLNEKLLKEREEIEKALQEANKSIPTKLDYQQKIVTLQNAISALQDPTTSVAAKNKLLKMCIKRITYNREQSERIGGVWHKHPIELNIELTL
jgi:hypothetical protein